MILLSSLNWLNVLTVNCFDKSELSSFVEVLIIIFVLRVYWCRVAYTDNLNYLIIDDRSLSSLKEFSLTFNKLTYLSFKLRKAFFVGKVSVEFLIRTI
jgi:hypothetical protein